MKGDYEGMHQHLVDFKLLEELVKIFMRAEDCSTEAVWTNFKSMLIELRGKFVPKILTKLEWKIKGIHPENE